MTEPSIEQASGSDDFAGYADLVASKPIGRYFKYRSRYYAATAMQYFRIESESDGDLFGLELCIEPNLAWVIKGVKFNSQASRTEIDEQEFNEAWLKIAAMYSGGKG